MNASTNTTEAAPALGVSTGSPAAGRADELRREGRRWWRLEQKAVRRRDYTAAKEYAALSDKYYAQADAAEQENHQRSAAP
jgi:hypothetical protein